MTSLKKYRGNEPRNVSQVAKYHVTSSPGEVGWKVELHYELDRRTRVLLPTHDHPDLVQRVNKIKEEIDGTGGGAFYVDEYANVVVPPRANDAPYYDGGKYADLLEFEFEGDIISSRAPRGCRPGDRWEGPRVGIPYTLTAGGEDIRYRRHYANLREDVVLSDVCGRDAAHRLAARLSVDKPRGGRIYINECREFFAPVEDVDGWSYIYLGPLGDDAWFPDPS